MTIDPRRYTDLFESGVDPGPLPDDPAAPEYVEPPAEPLPPEPLPKGEDLCAWLDWPSDDDLVALCDVHLKEATSLVHGATRGRGFSVTKGLVAADLFTVILSVAARSVTNPSGAKRMAVGGIEYTPTPLVALSVAERMAVGRYRQAII